MTGQNGGHGGIVDPTALDVVLSQRLTSPRHASLAALNTWYENKRPAPGSLPARSEIIPAEIVPHLASIALVEPVYGPGEVPHDFYFRVFGSELGQQAGLELTGKFISDHPDDLGRARMKTILGHVVDSAAPLSLDAPLVEKGREFLRCESLFLPFASDGQKVDYILFESQFSSLDR